ncbi:MAG: anti-sigma factor antagonist [Gemmataceae bacterium]|nr:anti-sigma factor antagonist [Gemmataceae bacterium]
MAALTGISYEKTGDVLCIRFKNLRPSELEIQDCFQEIKKVIQDEKTFKVALSLGPNMECMYSVFLGKLISLQKLLSEGGGKLFLCHVEPMVRSIFTACRLEDRFNFCEDFPAAGAEFAKK